MAKSININRNGKLATILVTDAGRGSAVAIIRSLGRQGYKVIAADSDSQSLGFRSRYTHTNLIYPSPEEHIKEFCSFMLNAVKSEGVDLIVPVTDLTIQPLNLERKAFEQITQLATPSQERLEAVTDKAKTVELARKLGVPVPKTFIVDTTEAALEKSKELGWPVVLKPQASRQVREGKEIESYQVTYAGDEAELERAMSKLAGRCSVLLQRLCRGTGCGVELLMKDGEPLAAFQHKRLREIPVSGGASAYREGVKLDPKLYDYSVRILSELRWTGLAMVEFKLGEEGPELMEINGRVWGSLPLAVASGVDFPGLMTKMYLNGSSSSATRMNSTYKTGVRCRDLQKDMMWITSVLMRRQEHPFLKYPERKRAIKALMGMLNPKRKFDLLCIDDPMPGFAELPRIIKKFKKKMSEEKS